MKGSPVLFVDKESSDSSSSIELLTVYEAAEVLKISVTGMRRLQQGRHLPFIKVGRSIRFSKRDIVSYLDKRRVESIE